MIVHGWRGYVKMSGNILSVGFSLLDTLSQITHNGPFLCRPRLLAPAALACISCIVKKCAARIFSQYNLPSLRGSAAQQYIYPQRFLRRGRISFE
jgi:hypothetical protein